MYLHFTICERKIVGEVILVPLGDSSLDVKGLITLNEAGELLWDALPDAESVQDLANVLTNEYDVSPETALCDAEAFLGKLSALGII